jgi:hypothetical protein
MKNGDLKYVEDEQIKLPDHPFDTEPDRIAQEINCTYRGETLKGKPHGMGIAVYNHIEEGEEESEEESPKKV